MAQRTQMRLHAITGSLSAIDAVASSPAAAADIGADHLLDILGQFAGAVRRIHGADDFTNQEAGKFEHATSQFIGILSASSDLKAGGALDIEGAADIAGASDLHGAVRAYSTLRVDQGADLKSTLIVSGTATLKSDVVVDQLAVAGGLVFTDASGKLDNDAKVAWDGSALKVDGILSGSGDLQVGGDLEVAGTSDLHGAVQMYSTLDVDGLATVSGSVVQDLNNGRVALVGASGRLVDNAEITWSAGQLTVSGSTVSKDIVAARDLTATRDLFAVSGSFSGDLTVTGDFTVNGTTTTVNTTELLVEDNMVVINKNEVGAGVTAGTAGLEIERGSLDNAVVQWLESNDRFELKVGTAYADLKLDDIDGKDATFSGTLNADGQVDLAASGVATNVHGTLVVDEAADFKAAVKVTGSADFGAAVSMQSTLSVAQLATLNNGLTVNAAVADFNAGITANEIKIDGDTATRLYIVDTDGSMKDEANLMFHDSKLYVTGGLDVSSAAHLASTLDVDSTSTFGDDMTLDKAAAQSILKTGGDLTISGSAALKLVSGDEISLDDKWRAGSTYTAPIALSNAQSDWNNFVSAFDDGTSLLAAIVAANGGTSGGKFVKAISATSASVPAAELINVGDAGIDFADGWSGINEPKANKVDIYVNGQLMISGSSYDYTINGGGDIAFSFDLMADDIVAAIVR